MNRCLGRRSSRLRDLISVVEDPANDLVFGDESEDFHLGSTSIAGQGINLVDSVDELSPSFVRGTSSGRGRGCGSRLDLPLLFVTNGLSVDSPHTIGVGAIKMNEMFVGLWDVNENSSQEL